MVTRVLSILQFSHMWIFKSKITILFLILMEIWMDIQKIDSDSLVVIFYIVEVFNLKK